ncbi:uncharacterized protein [Drosophila takahashii]|uniref:uncharacterized protein n=1 Tax=Drosophila takahashii TaxID=29030 RepID=UPI001CF90E26|nr:uncharacterized protein LOC108061336 [Drosophila takahashii]
MNYANLVIICASLVLPQLEMGAARATRGGIDPSLYSQGRKWNLTEEILNEMWLSKRPYIVTWKPNSNEVITDTYEFSPNGRNLLRSTQRHYEWRYPEDGGPSSVQVQENLDFLSNQLRQLASVFNNPFINPVGFGFPDFNIFKNLHKPNYGPNPFLPRLPDLPQCNCPRGGRPNEPNPEYRPSKGEQDPVFNEPNPIYIPAQDPSLNGRNMPSFPPQDVPNTQGRIPNRSDDNDPWLPRPPSTPRTVVPRPTLAPPNFDDSPPLWVPNLEQTTTTERALVPLPTLAPRRNGTDTSIDDFLGKVDITVADIKEEDGEFVTTIMDEQGRVLKASFALSDDKGQGGGVN